MGVQEKAALEVPRQMLTPKSSAFTPPPVFKALSPLPSFWTLKGGGSQGRDGEQGLFGASAGFHRGRQWGWMGAAGGSGAGAALVSQCGHCWKF